jgi:hypothetical protein
MTARPESLPAPHSDFATIARTLHRGLIVGWIVILLASAGRLGLRETFLDEFGYVDS